MYREETAGWLSVLRESEDVGLCTCGMDEQGVPSQLGGVQAWRQERRGSWHLTHLQMPNWQTRNK